VLRAKQEMRQQFYACIENRGIKFNINILQRGSPCFIQVIFSDLSEPELFLRNYYQNNPFFKR